MTAGHAYTQIPGHGLQAEGKPFEWEARADRWRRADGREGHALCSCGEASESLDTDAARKRWHVVHKEQVIRANLPGGTS